MGDIQGYTALCQLVPYTEVPALRWPRDPCTGSTNALLESPRVKDNIILEMAKQKKSKKKKCFSPTCYFQFSADDRKKRHTQKLKEKQIQNRCQEILCSPEEEKIDEKNI